MADDSGQEIEKDPVTVITETLKQVLGTLKSLLGREEGLSQEMRDAETEQGAGTQPKAVEGQPQSEQQDQGREQPKNDLGEEAGDDQGSPDSLQPTLQ